MPKQSGDKAGTEKTERTEKEAQIPVRMPPEQHRRYKVLAAESGISMKEAALRGLEIWESMQGKLPAMQLQVLGMIPGGPAHEVQPLSNLTLNVEQDVVDEFGLRGDEYALIVDGDSMLSARADSLESGDYAIFRGDLDPCGKVAHVEWEDDGAPERMCTVKLVRCPDKNRLELCATNPQHEPQVIVKRRRDVAVRGVLVGSLPAAYNAQ